MSTPFFHSVMADFLHKLQAGSFTERPEVYVLTFQGQAPLHFFSRDGKILEVSMEAGRLNNRRAADVLLRLLHLNHAGGPGVLSCIAVTERSDTVQVRASLPLTECTAGGLCDLTRHIRARAEAASALLHGAAASPVVATGGSLVRLRLRSGRP